MNRIQMFLFWSVLLFVQCSAEAFLRSEQEPDKSSVWGDTQSDFSKDGILVNGKQGNITVPDDPVITLKWQKWFKVCIFKSYEETGEKETVEHLIRQDGAPWNGVRDQSKWPDGGWRPQHAVLETYAPGFLKINVIYHFKGGKDSRWTEYTMFLEFRQYNNGSMLLSFGHCRIAFHNPANIPGDQDWYTIEDEDKKSSQATFRYGDRFVVTSYRKKDWNKPFPEDKEAERKDVIHTVMLMEPDEKYENHPSVAKLVNGPDATAKKTWFTYVMRLMYGKRPVTRQYDVHENITKVLETYKDGEYKDKEVEVSFTNKSYGEIKFHDTIHKKSNDMFNISNGYVYAIIERNDSMGRITFAGKAKKVVPYTMLSLHELASKNESDLTSSTISTTQATTEYVTLYPARENLSRFLDAPGWKRWPASLFLILPFAAGLVYFLIIVFQCIVTIIERMTDSS